MDRLTLILITGRSTRQGIGISEGKERPEYQEATAAIDLNQMDMSRSGLRNGDPIRLKTPHGMADVICRQADIPEGLAFIPFGPVCNRLIGDETYASGTPDSKHLWVEIMKESGDRRQE